MGFPRIFTLSLARIRSTLLPYHGLQIQATTSASTTLNRTVQSKLLNLFLILILENTTREGETA